MKIAVSACLLGHNVKYSGGNNRNEELIDLLKDHEVVFLCPETAGGLGVPRDASERQADRVVSCTGKDVTAEYSRGTELCMQEIIAEDVQLVILKARSPACGKGHIYDGTFSHTLIERDGTLAEAVRAAGLPFFSEEEITDIKAYLCHTV